MQFCNNATRAISYIKNRWSVVATKLRDPAYIRSRTRMGRRRLRDPAVAIITALVVIAVIVVFSAPAPASVFRTLIATFTGAGFAFVLQNLTAAKRKRAENLAAANRCIFLLARFLNQLELIRDQVIEPVRNSPGRVLEMKPVLYLDYKDMKIEVGPMSFLLQTKFANLLGGLVVQEQRFHSAIDALNQRSRFHLEEIQPRLEMAGIRADVVYTGQQIRQAMGDRLFTTLRTYTDQAINTIDETTGTVERTARETVDAIKELFPNLPVIGFRIERPTAQAFSGSQSVQQ